MKRVAIIKLGYSEYQVPNEMVPLLLQIRKIESSYRDQGYVYWYAEDDSDLKISYRDASKILDEEPPKNPPPPPPVDVKPVIVDGVIKAPPEDGSVGMQAARDLVAESGEFAAINWIDRK